MKGTKCLNHDPLRIINLFLNENTLFNQFPKVLESRIIEIACFILISYKQKLTCLPKTLKF